MNGVLVVDKAPGMTSHDVVGRVRRAVGVKRVGHAGTLDPDATGVLVVCIGPATRLADLIADQGKTYRCTLALGATTDSEDASGTILEEKDASGVTREMLETAAARFVGEIDQVPPMVSAVHHNGQRLYDLARRGITVEREARRIRVDSIQVLSFEPAMRAIAEVDVATGKGAYVRTLCADIGAALGVGGHMAALRRTAVGQFQVEGALPVDSLSREAIEERLIAPADAIPHVARVAITTDTDRDHLQHGRAIAVDEPDVDVVAAVDADGNLLALGTLKEGWLRPSKVFCESL